MIVVLLLAGGGFYFWLSGDEPEAPEALSQRASPPRPAYRPILPGPPVDSRQSPGRTFEFHNASPLAAPKFRPLRKGYPPGDDLQPLLTYPDASGYGRDTAMAPELPTYDSYYQPQAPAAPDYRFRPQDFKGKARRWTGNYPQYPGSGQVAPMRPGGPQYPSAPARPRQQSSPSASLDSLWAETRTPRR